MTPDSKATGSFHLSCCWTEKGSYLIFLLFLLLPLTPALPCVADERSLPQDSGLHDNLDVESGYASYDEATSTGTGIWRSLPGCTGLLHRCTHSKSFCFLSTLAEGEENCRNSYSRSSGNSNILGWLPSHTMIHKLSNGREVTCSLLDTQSTTSDGVPTKTVADRDDAGLCKGPLAPYDWIVKSSLGAARRSANSLKMDTLPGSSSLHVVINPPFLDWETVDLYSPSISYVAVTNSHNDSILHVYEPFSTDPQFYAQGFRELTLAPGETATVAFVFLPKQLGTSAAHVVLQTSFGGFIVNAKGLAVDSPYRVQLGTELGTSGTGGLIKNLLLYNPYNKSLLVEEVTVWLSLASGNVSHTSHASCHINDLSHGFSDIPINSMNSNKDTVERSRHGMPWVRLMPHNKWELSSDETETVLKVTILPYFEGKGVGVICVRLHDSSQSKTEMIMVPIEEVVKEKVGFHSLTNSVSAFLEPLDLCGDGGSTFILSLRNDASELLQLLKIMEVTESKKHFSVRYAENMLLYPGSLTHVALVRHAFLFELKGMPSTDSRPHVDCKLRIVTNDSTHPQIDIPCQALLHACPRQDNKFEPVVSIDSQLGSSTKFTGVKDLSSSGNLNEKDVPLKPYLFDILEAHDLILRNWKSQSTVIGGSLLEHNELTFSTVEVGNYAEKWVTLKNPSEQPVVAQLILNSGVISDHCKSMAGISCHIFSKPSPRSPIVPIGGFSLSETAVTGASIPPFGSSTLGPILFHPSDRCMWRGSVLIRNNLTGVEWLPLQGFGGSKSLSILEESQPVQKLEFNLDQPLPLKLSVEPKLGKDVSSSACSHLVSKEVLLRNTGELPFEVVKLQVSGNSCELDGFKIHACKSFALEPGESRKLHISYQPDFSGYVVQKDLQLALASGEIVIPMKVNIPVYMLKLCRRTFVWSFFRILLLVTFVGFSITAIFIGLPHASSIFYGNRMKKNNMNALLSNSQVGKPGKVHRNSQSSRPNRDDVKYGEGYMGASDEKVGRQDRTASIQFEKDLSCEEKVPMISHCLEEKVTEESSKCGSSENVQSSNLTVKIVKEKVKRKKRRPSGVGAGLAAKNEVSSSQSGNSTPSSPMSPNAFTPRRVWPASSEPITNSIHRNSSETKDVSDRSGKEVMDRVPGSSMKAMVKPAAIKCDQDTWRQVNPETVLPQRPSAKPVLTPSATFPSASWRSPDVAPNLRASASPIPPHARAPGSNLNKDKAVKRDEGTLERNDFTYDIWGNHLCDHIMGRSKDKEFSPRTSTDASEGDSLSFFARGPQSLVKMSLLRSESPNPRPPSFGVNYNHQMV